MKKVDIRKIYVGKIAKQSEVSGKINDVRFLGQTYKVLTNPNWEYDNNGQYGLFVKVPLYIGFKTAYKHILTGNPYFKADECSGGHEVIIPESLEKLTEILGVFSKSFFHMLIYEQTSSSTWRSIWLITPSAS